MAKEKGPPPGGADAPDLAPDFDDESRAEALALPDLHAPTVGRRIAQFRTHLGLSQTELATRVGGSKIGLGGNERGVAAPNSRMLYGLLLLGANLNWLLGGQGPMLRRDLSRPPPPVDTNVLTGVVEALEEYLDAQGLVLSAGKKAQLVSLLYEQCIADGGAVDEAAVIRLVKLAA